MTKIKKRTLLRIGWLILFTLIVFMLISGAGFCARKSVKITMWYSVGGNPRRATEALVKWFNKVYPEVKMKAVYSGNYEDTTQKLLAAVVAGNPPTIAHMAHCYAPQLVKKGYIQALDDFIAKDPEVSKDDFVASLYKTNVYQGKVYGVPFNCSNPVVYYNRDLFRKAGLNPDNPPKTWDEAYNVAKKISKLGEGIYGYNIERGSGWISQGYVWQFGGEWIKPDNSKVLWDSKESIAALSFMKKMVNDGIAVYKGGNKLDISGKVGMVIRSTASLTYLEEHCPFDLGVTVQPYKVRKMVPLGGGSLYMFKNISEVEKQAAWKFMKYVTNPINQMFWAVSTGYMASNKKAVNSALMEKRFIDDPRTQVTYLQLPYSRPEDDTWLAPFLEVRDIFNDAWDRCILNNLDPEKVLKEATEKANKILQEYK